MPELAFAHYEIGEKLREPEHLRKAESILSNLGATPEREVWRALLVEGGRA